MTVVVAVCVAGCSSGSRTAITTTPPPVAQTVLEPSPSTMPSSVTRARASGLAPEPVDSTVDGLAVRTLAGDPLSSPIDLVLAFGSVWVANHRGATVTRVDPETMTVQATIRTGQGPGWFVVTDDAVWVSNQMGVGMTRIDPGTNATSDVGDWPPCGRGVFAFRAIWQPACDMGLVMRIDPTSLTATNVTSDQRSVLRLGSTLLSGGPAGLARLDPKANSFAPIGGADPGWLMAFDGRTIWTSDERKVSRIDPADGTVVAMLAIAEAGAVAFRDGRVWVTSRSGLVEIDPRTTEIVRTIPVGPTLSVINDGGGLWVTSFDGNGLIRIRM
ncbi:MAG TPA: hypothetical protein VM408_00535 [Methylomirabilota bacterium]|nr:hypothetical protein [Methylomirabilota bacterium]